MYELIVLGIVPGTQIQITFEMWLWTIGSLCMLGIAWKIHRVHAFLSTAIAFAFLSVIARKPNAGRYSKTES